MPRGRRSAEGGRCAGCSPRGSRHRRGGGAEPVLLLDVARAIESGLAAAIVVAWDRGTGRRPPAPTMRPRTAPRLAVEGGSAGAGQGRRFVAIGDEDEVGAETGRHFHRAEQPGRDTAVAFPGHAPIQGAQRTVQGGRNRRRPRWGVNRRNGRRSVNRPSATRDPQGSEVTSSRKAAFAVSRRLAGLPSAPT